VIPPGLAVVTGASAGIGREFCVQLAQRGHHLLIVARDAGRLAELASELEAKFRVTVEWFPADLSREDEIVGLGERIAGASELSLLVNNAGFGTRGTLVEADRERQAQMLRLHTMAPMRLTAAALPVLLRRKGGAVINVASIAAFFYSAGSANYCATKAYLTTFTEGIAAELDGTGVRAQALCPGFTITEFHQRKGEAISRRLPLLWLTAETVVRRSLRNLDRGGPTICVPGLGYRLLVGAVRLTPRVVIGRVAAWRRARLVT
jgi:short-subunit dehydrogenase